VSFATLPAPKAFACVGLDCRAQVPLPADRIDQIAAATAVARTDRSKSRWKTKTNEQKGSLVRTKALRRRREEASSEANPQPESIESMT